MSMNIGYDSVYSANADYASIPDIQMNLTISQDSTSSTNIITQGSDMQVKIRYY